MHLGSIRPGNQSRTAVKRLLHSQLAAFAPRRCLDPDVFSGSTVSTTDTTVLFVDLAGFTNLTEALATFGTRGTEQLSEVVGDFFSRVTEQVLEHDGDPLSYGGDALTITFDGPASDAMERAQTTAAIIHHLTSDVSDLETVGGRISLAARIGIASGPVSTAVSTSTTRASPFHLGSTLDDAVAAESRAQNGHTVVAAGTDPSPSEHGRTPTRTPFAGDFASLDLEKLVHPLVLEHLERGTKLPSSHRTVTVSFIGFPPVHPGDVPRFQRLVSSLLTLVANNGGEVVQVSGGDKGIVAFVVFGAPVAHDDDPMRAMQTMLELRRLDPSIRVGITSGPVFATYLGTPQRRFPAHFGRAVNTAARLMQRAEAREILVSPETWRSTGAFLRQRGATRELALKGVHEPLVVRAVAGWRTQRRPGPREPLMPIIGRDMELISIERFLGRIATGGGGSVTVSGEPGIGKSRLAQETVDRARTRGMNVFSVDADDYPQTQQYRLWRHLLFEMLGLPPNTKRELLIFKLRELVPEHQNPLDQVAPLIGMRSSARRSSSDAQETLEQEMALETLTRALSSGLSDNLTLFVFENTHRLDSLSVKLMRELATSVSHRRVGLLSVGRPTPIEKSFAAEFIAQHDAQLVLEELDLTSAGAVADDYWLQLGGGTPPGWLHEAVTARAGGNPLLIRTATRVLMASWSPGSPAPRYHAMDATPTRVVVDRIDNLSVPEQRVLTILASSSGPCSLPFLVEVLTQDQTHSETESAVERLEETHLIRQIASVGPTTFRIRHHSLQQVVYERMSHTDRAATHLRMANQLIAEGSKPRDVAEHVLHVDSADLARIWYPRAAADARSLWLIPEAIEWWERAIPLLTAYSLEEAQASLLEDLVVGGRPNDALALADDVSTRAATDPASTANVRRHLAIAEAALACGAYERAESDAHAVIHHAGGNVKALQQRASELLVLSLCERGDAASATTIAREQVEAAQHSGSDIGMMIANASLGAALFTNQEFAEAELYYQVARNKAEYVDDAVHEIHILSDLGGCALELGDYETCLHRLAQARRRAEEIGYRRHLALSLTNEASVRIALGDPFGAACHKFAFERSMELGDLPTAAHCLQFWFLSDAELSADPSLFARLAEVSRHIGREQVTAQLGAQFALAAAKSNRWDEYAKQLAESVGSDPSAHGPDVARRVALAQIVHEASRLQGDSTELSQLVHQLGQLGEAPDVSEVERADLAVEQWRLSPTAQSKQEALESVRAAFDVEPSAIVKGWISELDAGPAPDRPPLPPPAGIGDAVVTTAQALSALEQLERAVGVRRI